MKAMVVSKETNAYDDDAEAKYEVEIERQAGQQRVVDAVVSKVSQSQ